MRLSRAQRGFQSLATFHESRACAWIDAGAINHEQDECDPDPPAMSVTAQYAHHVAPVRGHLRIRHPLQPHQIVRRKRRVALSRCSHHAGECQEAQMNEA